MAKRVKVLVPYATGNLYASGDVVEVEDGLADSWISGNYAEETTDDVTVPATPEAVYPTSLPVGTSAEPETTTESAGANVPFEPLPTEETEPAYMEEPGVHHPVDDMAVLKGEEPVAEEAEIETGTGPYEGRTVTQLREVAKSKGLPTSGTKDELIARLRD